MLSQPVFERRTATPVCPFFYECGGCDAQDVPYADQLSAKQAWAELLFAPLLGEHTDKRPIIGEASEFPVYFRNKIRFSFIRDNDDVVHPSRHRKGSTSSDIPVDQCFLQSPESDSLINWVAAWATQEKWSLYDPTTKQGWLKHLLIRQGKHTGDLLVSTVADTPGVPDEKRWVSAITQAFPGITSLHHSQSYPQQPARITTRLLAGKEKLTEKVGEYTFVISPHAFFQTNGTMVETLYSEVQRQAGEGEIAWDLYAGSATIGLFVSKNFTKVVSIEQNPANIADAQENLTLNGVSNIDVVAGTVEDRITSAFFTSNGPANAIIIDPPRAGIHPNLRTILPTIVKQSPGAKLVYVSCNPSTALRDCAVFVQAGLRITTFQPIDMFPHSIHCEIVMTLEAPKANK